MEAERVVKNVAIGRRGGAEPAYHLLWIEAGRHPFLATLFAALDAPVLRIWVDAAVSETSFDRACNGGLITAIAECDGRSVAVVWSDFRVNGASFGRANSTRFVAFLRHLRQSGQAMPLIYVINSAGVSIMEGRTTFSTAFGIWPELLSYAESQLLLTCAVDKCLGLAPLLFGLGHYRVAVADRTQVNLTGPDVLRMFFGRGCAFEERAAAERCVEQNELIHEVVPSTSAAFALFRQLLGTSAGATDGGSPVELGPRTAGVLGRILEGPSRELVPGWCPRVRLFFGTRGGRPVGVFVNPLERSDNLITVRTLDKYAAGLDLFRALRVPIISVLDSPGIDPRFEQGDANNIRRILEVGERIIRYPYGAMGIGAGRCFGGATTLGFPKVFGGRRAVVLRGAQVGVMDDRIVGELLSASPRLSAQWRATVAARGSAFEDLLQEGSLDDVIGLGELPAEVDRFLEDLAANPPVVPLRPVPGRPSSRWGNGAAGEWLEVMQ
jgi:acetyl-CoA carboxylase carboxyltransferase component